jgi:hypothetical protein
MFNNSHTISLNITKITLMQLYTSRLSNDTKSAKGGGRGASRFVRVEDDKQTKQRNYLPL